MREGFTTSEAAAWLGVSRETLYSWIRAGRVTAPPQITLGKRSMRVWSTRDIARVGRQGARIKRGRPKGTCNREVSSASGD
jgi:excisionase family DNA binding protein